MSEQEQPKIIVDSDWKQQARKEKEKLAEQASKQAPHPGGAPEGERPVDFLDIVRSLASQALLYMGAIPDPETGRAILAPDMARLQIDMLGVLEEKTRGNLSEEEAKALGEILNELRFQFVEVSKAINKAIEEGKIRPQDLSGGVAPGAAGAAPGPSGGGPAPSGGGPGG